MMMPILCWYPTYKAWYDVMYVTKWRKILATLTWKNYRQKKWRRRKRVSN